MAGNLLHAIYPTKIVKHSGFTTTITDSFLFVNAIAVTWDNTDVYMGNLTSFKKGTGFGSAVQSSFAVPGGSNPYGMDWTGTDLLGAFNVTKRYKFSGFSSTVSDSFTGAAACRGVAWDGTNLLDAEPTPKIYKRSGFSATVSDSFTANAVNRDITWDGTDLYGASDLLSVKKYSGFSSTVSSSITVSGTEGGIDWDDFPAPAAAAIAPISIRTPGGGVATGGSLMF